MTIREIAGQATDALRRSGVASPILDAEILVCHAASIGRVCLLTHPEMELTEGLASRIWEAVQLRTLRVPVPYITGFREFMGLSFAVTPATLIPRPETESLVETALRFAHCRRKARRAGGIRLLDVGTGSGAIGLSLAHDLPDATVVATDISANALRVARRNAQRLGVIDRVGFVCGDLLRPLRRSTREATGCFDVIAANLPYVRSDEFVTLQAEVRDHEPRAALDGGADGLDLYRALIPQASGLLVDDGLLVVEVGIGQSHVVKDMFHRAELTTVEVVKDLAGIDRVVAGNQPGPNG
ncbi:MAG: protein-(glutamine-N5) methyltransferase, release factor-specific [Armatimonadetes bacterium CG2_30_59_28]|nr:peptide chain release factor N(5)-glutamine methyltransferase [Armatimonadota bacterium]OIO94040.1 MAG: protein-(glutamine-N5) methyltransferase, release factor-specific [Armatimonadetes bacterium CG2_30_59_28]PIU62027.1 MAG: peptide chain release factor N(5)-glutamine methyltransferase [Armatimonadetes bacterium CG07_land_8_20_14_0_80_59_28]PIX44551.1 MAG: peptide chain release factor N(5)-glutamine methyltransferase [Armatimonadetes bacterium CG_4_8_14_3_um_filter_58_9]PIY48808.1 MAG: pept